MKKAYTLKLEKETMEKFREMAIRLDVDHDNLLWMLMCHLERENKAKNLDEKVKKLTIKNKELKIKLRTMSQNYNQLVKVIDKKV